VKFPVISSLPSNFISFGVGLDIPWETTPGFRKKTTGDELDEVTKAFFSHYGEHFNHVFPSFQPKDRARLSVENYFHAFFAFFTASKKIPVRALHHTMLNIAGGLQYNREQLISFTNDLIAQFDLAWVNEDVGIWSLHGKSLPYPLPPILSEQSLAEAITVARQIKSKLNAPLILEFPGFTEGSAIILGELNAFDYFRILAEEADCAVTLDAGHILSYQWLCKKIGEDTPALSRLPLKHCFEVHLAGSEIAATGFRDMHHGILLPEQFSILAQLLEDCPNLKAVTYEDPKFDAAGYFRPDNIASFKKLSSIIHDFNGKNHVKS
jgi:uncharacterized protein